ncbi:MAG TPA: LLM class F420-dependent oxidoreductase [Mycobacterium sp.]|nr:LLM class F420-dependent oxidoreductase [Mycobacterium sp.]
MEIGFHFVNFDVPGGVQALPSTLAAAARAAEQAGASWFTMADHFFQMDNLWPAEAPMLEIYTALGYLAGQTQRIKLVVLVSGVNYHHPGLLAKTATTLDVLSGGRLVFGLGAAWYERECVGLGVPFPPLSERYERLEETLQICRQMWSSDNGRYDGKYYQLAETVCSPQPIQRPNPPVLLGGTGERKTLRLVAQYADSWNGAFQTVEEAAHKIDVLYRHCDAVGRDPGEIQKTAFMLIDPMADLDGFLCTAERYAALGIDLINIMPPEDTTDPVAFASRLGELVIPRVAQIGCGPKPRGPADHLHAA